MIDKKTNISRRFGFITFSKDAKVQKILAYQPHFINNKQIEVKLALPR